MPTRPLDTAIYQAIACQLCELQMARQQQVQTVAKQFGLSSQQLTLMWHLNRQDQPTMGTMAEIMDCDISNITVIADKLESRGLLRRVRSQDRRVKRLELTESGVKLRTEVIDQLHEPEPWLAYLNTDERQQLSHLLSRCLEAVNQVQGHLSLSDVPQCGCNQA